MEEEKHDLSRNRRRDGAAVGWPMNTVCLVMISGNDNNDGGWQFIEPGEDDYVLTKYTVPVVGVPS